MTWLQRTLEEVRLMYGMLAELNGMSGGKHRYSE